MRREGGEALEVRVGGKEIKKGSQEERRLEERRKEEEQRQDENINRRGEK